MSKKRKNQLTIKTFDEVISFAELRRGAKKSCLGVLWKDSIAHFSLNLIREVNNLHKELSNGSYKIRKYQVFKIHEPKERTIVATRIQDRAFQRSLCDNILTPAITRSFIYDNCACQKGKGVDFALNRLDYHLHAFYRKHKLNGYVLQCDIYHFFPETKHDVAKAAVRKRVKDDRAYEAVATIIDSFGGEKGIGLGSQVSQLVQLAVLDDLDHYIKEQLHIKYYVRYMDDFILIHEDKEYLRYCLLKIREKLKEIELTLNKKTCIYNLSQGIKFLQWHFILTKNGKVLRRISKSSIKRERVRLKKLANKVKSQKIPISKLDESFQCWYAHANRGDSRGTQANMRRLYKKLHREVDNNDFKQGTCGSEK